MAQRFGTVSCFVEKKRDTKLRVIEKGNQQKVSERLGWAVREGE